MSRSTQWAIILASSMFMGSIGGRLTNNAHLFSYWNIISYYINDWHDNSVLFYKEYLLQESWRLLLSPSLVGNLHSLKSCTSLWSTKLSSSTTTLEHSVKDLNLHCISTPGYNATCRVEFSERTCIPQHQSILDLSSPWSYPTARDRANDLLQLVELLIGLVTMADDSTHITTPYASPSDSPWCCSQQTMTLSPAWTG